MARRTKRKFDIYREICPASAITIIGAGIVILAVGDIISGGAFIFSGLIVGSMAPVKGRRMQTHELTQELQQILGGH